MKKAGKWTLFGTIGVVLLMLNLAHCISFSMKPEKVDRFFHQKKLEPIYESYESGNRTIEYVSVGDPSKPLVLFVHGSPGSWSNFISFMGNSRLLEQARIVSVDRPGFGGSGRGNPQRSIQQQAADLRPILEQNPSGKAILVGHSLGGPVIARMAMDYPQLINCLIMVAPSIDPQLEKTKWFQIPADWLIFSWMIPKDLVTSNREILPLKGELEKMLPLWPKIKMPVTVIQGEADRLVPSGNADFAKKVLVNAPLKMVRVPDLNHFVPWNRPDLIEDAVLEHIAKLSHPPEAELTAQ